MARLASWLVVAVVTLGAVFVAATSGQLPERVATHFGPGGVANGWMPRVTYVALTLAFAVLLPLIVAGAVGWLPARFERFLNVPHRDHWLAPARREQTLATLQGYGAVMAIATALMAVGAHAAVLAANRHSPPRLDEPIFLAGLGVLVAVILGCVVAMHRRFRRATVQAA
jgi:uncharacterized membrane protein